MPSTIRDLTELTTVAVDDYLLISDTSDVTNRDKRISRANLLGGALTGGGTVATGGFTLTVPATGTASLLGTAQSFSALKTFSAGINLGQASTLDFWESALAWPTPPALTFTSNGGHTYSAQTGFYFRLGNLVFFDLDVRLSSKGTSTGGCSLINLPYPSNDARHIVWCRWQSFTTAILGLMGQFNSGNSTIMGLYAQTAAATSTLATPLNDTHLSATSIIIASGFYRCS